MSDTATAATPTDVFLKYAPERNIAIVGTLAASTGGSQANITWQSLPPETPVWATSVDFEVTSTISVTLPAAVNFTVSPFAPYSIWSLLFTIAGAPPWNLMECTPFLFDNTTNTRDFDPGYTGLGNNAGYLANVVDTGPQGQNFNTASVAPGVTVTSTSASAIVVVMTWTYNIHVELQRLRRKLWGAIPLGDPKNRLATTFQMNPLIGTNPEQNAIVNAGAGVTATTTGTTTVVANYNVRDIDILPAGVATPSPTVGLGLTINSTSISVTAAGQQFPFQHTDAMAYTAIHHILVNSEVPIRPDYMGLWLTQEQKSARWDYDSQANTLAEYWLRWHRKYHRYPYRGQFTVDLSRGGYPDIPSADPLDAIMSPDDSYAAMFGIASTPSMQTTMRIASGTALSTAYARIYEFGLVKVPY